VKRGRGEGNEKGYKKAEEFRKYLDGERSARDPRFDLKVFQYVHLLLLLLFILRHLFMPCQSLIRSSSLLLLVLSPYSFAGKRH